MGDGRHRPSDIKCRGLTGGGQMKLSRYLLLVLFASSSVAQVTVIKAGRLVQPDEGTVATDQVIVIRANKIEAVGPGLAIPAGATVIDLSRMTVLPGLIDCHTHLADGTLADGNPVLHSQNFASQPVLDSVRHAHLTLDSGLT